MRLPRLDSNYWLLFSIFVFIASISIIVLIFIDHNSFYVVDRSKAQAVGSVTDKNIEPGGRGGPYKTITYKFRARNGQQYENTQSLHISKHLYDSVRQGSSLIINYSSTNPTHSFINGTEPTLWTYVIEVTVAALFCVISAWSFFYFKRK